MKYLVIREETCPECRGDGWVEHPAWQRLGERWKEMSRHDLRMYFSGEGYGDIPPEEVECSRCRGSGIVRQEVTLQQALREIMGEESIRSTFEDMEIAENST